jgi:SH3 domain protein
VDILERGDGWTKIRANGVDVGWIPAGYLQVEMPAQLRLGRFETESADLRDQLAKLTRDSDRLREENETLTGQDSSQKQELAQLTQENIELRAGARWPDRIAGAAILGAGMLLGAILQRRTGRRQGPRIKL